MISLLEIRDKKIYADEIRVNTAKNATSPITIRRATVRYVGPVLILMTSFDQNKKKHHQEFGRYEFIGRVSNSNGAFGGTFVATMSVAFVNGKLIEGERLRSGFMSKLKKALKYFRL